MDNQLLDELMALAEFDPEEIKYIRDLQGNLKMSLHHNNNDGHLKIVDVQVKDGRFMPVTLP